jgi:hypothetical protein
MIKLKLKRNHIPLVLWAADCAQHVLLYFEKEYPRDDRPRKAIAAARAWVSDEITVGAVRSAAFAAHAAARNANHAAAHAAARAAGHAAASVHVASHAPHAANYAVTAAEAANILGEREWQYQHLPKHLLPLMKKSKISKILRKTSVS